MTKAEAIDLLGVLAAAYPRQELSNATTALYVDRLQRERYEPARDAIESLVDSSRWFPAISEIRDEIARYRDRYAPKALEEPELTEEERQENLRRIRDLASRIGRSVDEPAETG